ncbi:MAG: winged helix-turn-helix domain-containing protein [Pseudomonadota bacterium]|nr:winged helix-turn-helix domain-containing protein [Pseudomonadota bacterium]
MIPSQGVCVVLVDRPQGAPDDFERIVCLRREHPRCLIVAVITCGPQQARSPQHARAYRSGADLCLTGPADGDELAAAVAALERRRVASSPEAGCAVGAVHANGASTVAPEPVGITLNLQRLRLVGNGGEVTLTPDEATLLRALAQAPGLHLGLTMLVEQLGQDLHSLSKASLEVRIVRIRKKLLQAGAVTPVIQAVRGQGYRLCQPLTVAPG